MCEEKDNFCASPSIIIIVSHMYNKPVGCLFVYHNIVGFLFLSSLVCLSIENYQ